MRENKKIKLINLPALLRARKKQKDSLDRAVKKVAEYLSANEFELFLTITFDPRRLRSYTPVAAAGRLRTWLHRQSLNSRAVGKEFKYIVFPDISRNKHLLEFHIVLSGYAFELKRSGIVIDGTLAYTVTAFKGGFTKARSLEAFSKSQLYELVLPLLDNADYEIFHNRRYWVSHYLDGTIADKVNTIARVQASYNLDAIHSLGVLVDSPTSKK